MSKFCVVSFFLTITLKVQILHSQLQQRIVAFQSN